MDDRLSLVMLTSAGYEGWANLVLDGRRERRFIAVLPPPVAAALKEHFAEHRCLRREARPIADAARQSEGHRNGKVRPVGGLLA
jgi:hypothetical protein